MVQVLLIRDMLFGHEANLESFLVLNGNTKVLNGKSLERGWVNISLTLDLVKYQLKKPK